MLCIGLRLPGQFNMGQMVNQSDFTANRSVISENIIASNLTNYFDNPATNVTPFDFTNTTGRVSPSPSPDAFTNMNCGTDFLSTACKVVQQLNSLKPDKVKDYGLIDYPPDVIKIALLHLDRGNLTKVLLNLPEDELFQLREKLSHEVFNSTLGIIPEPQRSEIINRSSK